jgi:hypothetical protein
MDSKLKQIISRIEKLEEVVFGKGKHKKEEREKKIVSSMEIDFSLNERAFVKRHAADKSGPKKFVLLVAYLARGELNKDIELTAIKKLWNKMSAKQLLGGFNMFYPNEAKTKGWLDSRTHGNYALTKEWKNVL